LHECDSKLTRLIVLVLLRLFVFNQ